MRKRDRVATWCMVVLIALSTYAGIVQEAQGDYRVSLIFYGVSFILCVGGYFLLKEPPS